MDAPEPPGQPPSFMRSVLNAARALVDTALVRRGHGGTFDEEERGMGFGSGSPLLVQPLAEPPPKPLTSRLTCGHQATMSRPQIVFSVGTGRSKVSNSVHIPLRSGTADCAQIV